MKQHVALLALFAAATLLSQDIQNRYTATKCTTLSSAAEKVTIQQPTSGAKVVVGEVGWVYCSVACTFAGSWGGTAATTTSLTITRSYHSPAPSSVAFSSSNAGSGTAGPTHYVSAGGTYSVDMSKFYMDANGTAQNFSLGTNSISGDACVSIQYIEK